MSLRSTLGSLTVPKFPAGIARGLLTNLGQRVKGALGVLQLDAESVMSPALLFEEHALAHPGRPFLRFEGEEITWGEMRERVVDRAASFVRAGVRWGDVIAVVMQNHPEYLISVLALSWIGATSSLINTGLTGPSLKHALLQTSLRGIVASRELIVAIDEALDQAPESAELLRFFEDTAKGEALAEDFRGWKRMHTLDEKARESIPPHLQHAARTLGSELFAYIFTSGTTGLPKGGKILNARAMVGGLGFGLFTMGLTGDDVVFVCLPLFHGNGFIVGFGSVLHSGGTLALSRKLSVSRFWDEVTDSQATAFVYIGEVCRYLVASPPHPRERSHRVARIIGNGMRPDVWPDFTSRFGIPFVHEFYAATEGNVNMSNLFGIEGSVGRMPPIPHLNNAYLARFDSDTELPLRDKRGRCIPCKPGEVGELLGKIDDKYVTMRFDGYIGEEATKKKVLRDVEKKGDAYFRSGDLMKRDVWGFYYFVDRIGDTFRWKGENVATNEVQDAVCKWGPIESANVYGVAVPGMDGRAGMAALALKPGAHFSPEPFYEHVTRLLPTFAVPAFVRLLEEAAMTATFKLKKTDLVREGFDPTRTKDLLFYRDDRKKSYEPVDADVFARIGRGEIRL